MWDEYVKIPVEMSMFFLRLLVNVKLPNANHHFRHSFSKFLSSSDLIQDSAHCRPCARKYRRSIHHQAPAKTSKWKTGQEGFNGIPQRGDLMDFGDAITLMTPSSCDQCRWASLVISLPPSVCLGPSNALGNVPATALPAAQFADWCRQAMSSRENQSQKPRLLLQLADVVNSRSNIQKRVEKKKAYSTLIRTCYKLNPERINIWVLTTNHDESWWIMKLGSSTSLLLPTHQPVLQSLAERDLITVQESSMLLAIV